MTSAPTVALGDRFHFRVSERGGVHVFGPTDSGVAGHHLRDEATFGFKRLPHVGVEAAFGDVAEDLHELVLVSLSDDAAFALLDVGRTPWGIEMMQRNEALLAFRREEARDRFAKQAGAYGLEILDTIPQLNSARVRYGRLENLHDSLAASSGDYASVRGVTLSALLTALAAAHTILLCRPKSLRRRRWPSLDDQISLAQALWESINASLPEEAEDAAVRDAIRRDDEISSGKVTGVLAIKHHRRHPAYWRSRISG